MITTSVIPAATATSQNLVVEVTEKVCKPFCILGSGPSATIDFVAGTPQLANGYVIVPITATTTIVSTDRDNCGCAHTQVFTETFDVGFTATTANSVAVLKGANVIVKPANVKCCKARAVKVTSTINVTIS